MQVPVRSLASAPQRTTPPVALAPSSATSMPPSVAAASNNPQNSPPHHAHSQNMLQPPALSPLVHECVDQFTSLPNELTRSFSDLRELDAVLRCTCLGLYTTFSLHSTVLHGLPFVIAVRTTSNFEAHMPLTPQTSLLYFTLC
jgi:hypothetical protein